MAPEDYESNPIDEPDCVIVLGREKDEIVVEMAVMLAEDQASYSKWRESWSEVREYRISNCHVANILDLFPDSDISPGFVHDLRGGGSRCLA